MVGMHRILANLVMAALLAASPAAIASVIDIGSMSISGGIFQWTLTDPSTPGGPAPSALPLTRIGPDTDLVGGYIGNGATGPRGAFVADPDAIVGLDLLGFPINVYTAAGNLGTPSVPVASITGGPVPTGTLDNVAGTISMELSSWFMQWRDDEWNVGDSNATGTWDPMTRSFNLSWSASIVGGFASGTTTTWVLEGTAYPVPIPAAAWLLGTGLVGLLGSAAGRPSTRT